MPVDNEDITRNYGAYHASGTFKSIYGEMLNPDAVRAIMERLTLLSGHVDSFSFLDFGCAYGRYSGILPLVNEKFPKHPCHYYGYEPFLSALKQFEGRIHEAGFVKFSGEDFNTRFEVLPDASVVQGPTYKNGNNSITLIHGSLSPDMDGLKDILSFGDKPRIDMISLAMLGTLGHMPNDYERKRTLRGLFDISGLGVILEVPERGYSFHGQDTIFTSLREKNKPVGLAVNEGDIYYKRVVDPSTGAEANIYYHLFTREEMVALVKSAGIKDAVISGTVAASKVPVRECVSHQVVGREEDIMVITTPRHELFRVMESRHLASTARLGVTS